MKASEIIKIKMQEIADKQGGNPLDYKIGSIWEYLDEEKERVNGILHEIANHLPFVEAHTAEGWVCPPRERIQRMIDELSDSAAKGSE